MNKHCFFKLVLYAQTSPLSQIAQIGRGLWCLTPLSTIFQLYRDGQFYCWKKPGYPEKTTDLSRITGKLSHNVVSSTPRHYNISGDMH